MSGYLGRRCRRAAASVVAGREEEPPPHFEPLEPRLLMSTVDAAALAHLQPALGSQLLRLMPMGDSITFGVGSTSADSGYDDSHSRFRPGYRGPLADLLVRQAGLTHGEDFDLVGTMRDGPFTYAGRPFDPDHQSYPGIEADRDSTRGLVWALQHDKDGDRVDDADGVGVFDLVQPGVILLHIGTNSITANEGPNNAGSARNQFARLLAFLRDVPELAETRILLAKLVPNVGGPADLSVHEDRYQRTVRYNDAMEEVVDGLAASDDAADRDLAARITFVDMFNAGDWVRDTNGNGVPDSVNTATGLLDDDGVHPTDAGYEVMARVWYRGLWDAGILTDDHADAGAWDQATPLQTLTGQAEQAGVFGLRSDSDLFQFSSSATGRTRLEVRAQADTDVLTLKLYDDQHRLLDIGGSDQGDAVSFDLALTPGRTYYVLVASPEDDTGPYTLRYEANWVDDFNGDARNDLLWYHHPSGGVRVWLMDGPDHIGTKRIMPWRSSDWQLAGMADFNDDGEADLVWHNTANGDNRVWLLHDDERAGVLRLDNFGGARWRIAGLADFNGDGQTDLLWHNPHGGWVRVWFMDGGTRIDETVVMPWRRTDWWLVGAADFDGDTQPDLIWHNRATGYNTVWWMDGADRRGADSLMPWRQPEWHLAALSDLNGDGQADLIWRNTRNGMNRVWYMQPGGDRLGAAQFQPWRQLDWQLAGSDLAHAVANPTAHASTQLTTASTLTLPAPAPRPPQTAAPVVEPAHDTATLLNTLARPRTTDLLALLAPPRFDG